MNTQITQEEFSSRFNYAMDVMNLSIHAAYLWAIDEKEYQENTQINQSVQTS